MNIDSRGYNPNKKNSGNNNNYNKKEQIPREYNPYKNPYSAYQGHP